jgi:cobalt/nickel transport system permease protein
VERDHRMSVRDELLRPYRPGASALHRLPAAAKLVGAFAFIVAVVLLPRDGWAGFAVAAVALALLAALSRVPPARLLARLLLVEPFAVGVALLSLLQPDGMRIFLGLLARSSLCLFCFVLLGSTTRFTDLLDALLRLRVPALLVTVLALTHRYLALLLEEAERLRRARTSRTCAPAGSRDWRPAATVVAQLFVRSSERAERVYAAMCARGWSHERR